jgi:zinc transport system ATP-binding protein
MLSVRNLCFAYERENVLENINFTYYKGDFLAIVGPNGGGKSTLLKLILGLLSPTSGEIVSDCARPSYVPQETLINQDFPITALDVVLMGRVGRFGRYTQADREAAHRALAEVEMEEHAAKKIGSLSGGQRQRVFIARALVCDSELLILDEPTASVDMQGQIQIYDLLKRLNRTRGVIIVSHDINVALGYATKIAYLSRTLFMHEPSALTKEIFFEKLRQSGEHNCPVDVLMTSTCTHTHGKRDSAGAKKETLQANATKWQADVGETVLGRSHGVGADTIRPHVKRGSASNNTSTKKEPTNTSPKKPATKSQAKKEPK